TDLAERHPHRALEVGAPGVHGYGVDRAEVALQVRAERGDGARGIAGAVEDDPSEARPELLFDRGPLRPEVDATEPRARGHEGQRPDRGVDLGGLERRDPFDRGGAHASSPAPAASPLRERASAATPP